MAQTHRSGLGAVRTLAAVRPRVPLANLKACSDAQYGDAQDGQVAVPVVREPSAVAVDEGVDLVSGAGADGPVERGAGQQEALAWFGVGLGGAACAGDGHAVLAEAGRSCRAR